MLWIEKKIRLGERKIVRRFAFWPVYLDSSDNSHNEILQSDYCKENKSDKLVLWLGWYNADIRYTDLGWGVHRWVTYRQYI